MNIISFIFTAGKRKFSGMDGEVEGHESPIMIQSILEDKYADFFHPLQKVVV